MKIIGRSPQATLVCLVSLTSQQHNVFPTENWSFNNSTNLWRVQAFRFRLCLALAYRSAIPGTASMVEKPTVALTTTGVLMRIFPILNEGKYIPAISWASRFHWHTGWYSSEYIVGTKSFGNIEFTAGLGFGRLAGRCFFKSTKCFII